MPGVTHDALKAHLLAKDNREAAALLLCSRLDHDRLKLLVKEILPVPHAECERSRDHLVWPGDFLESALDRAEEADLSIILIHSHPEGLFDFSVTDDRSDREVIPSLFLGRSAAVRGRTVHGSAIMIPGGAIRARLYDEQLHATPVELIAIYGDDILLYWNSDGKNSPTSGRPMAFTGRMKLELGLLSACVVGISGTGSVVAEQLARLGFGEIICIDFDQVEDRNLDRILNSTVYDAESGQLKVDVFAKAANKFRPATLIRRVPTTISCRDAILEACKADFLFSCVDSEEGRQICDRVAAAFLQPLFDVGVTIPVQTLRTGEKRITDICGRIDYVQPGGSSLADRKVFTPESLRAEYLARVASEKYAELAAQGYMPGIDEKGPSVITVNMRAASACVNEFIARMNPFRMDSNRSFARTTFSLVACEEDYSSEDDFQRNTTSLLGAGITVPLLGLPMLE